MAAQGKNSAGSTQKFIEVKDIVDNVVILDGGYACLVIEIQANNFALLSRTEQDSKIYAYASLLNSLSFPIQIIAQNKRVDLTSYLRLLDTQLQQASVQTETDPVKIGQRERFTTHMKLYRDFVQELIKVNIVLDKKFYIVVSYNSLEGGVGSATKAAKGSVDNNFVTSAKASLNTKAESLLSQLGRLNLRAKPLEKEELIKVFYSIYNQQPAETALMRESIENPVVKGAQT